MKVQATEEAVQNILLTLPVTKVDKAKRLVTGVASDETFDRQGEITDYATAKALFQNPDSWPGNIREMHQPKAVGKAIEVECDDATKTITVTARVSKGAPDTWEKVLDGTLSMYSIGGSGKRVTEKSAEGKTIKRLFLEQLAEVSLVDNGANPSAKFNIVKSVDGVVGIEKAAQLDEKDEEDDEEKDDTKDGDKKDKGKKAPPFTKKFTTIAEAAPFAKAVLTNLTTATDPDAARAVVVEIKKAMSAEVAKAIESYDIEQAACLIVGLNRLLSSETWEAQYAQASEASMGMSAAETKAQVQMLKQAGSLLVNFLVSEYNEQFRETPGNPGNVFSESAAIALFAVSTEVLKAGARHSKGDNELIQKVHDASVELSAKCMKDLEDGDVDKAVVTKLEAATETVTKLQGDLDAAKALLETQSGVVAKQAETISAFDARLKVVENQPAGGGPARMAVQKTLGGLGAGEETPSEHEPVLKAFDTLAMAARTDMDRTNIAMQKLKFMTDNRLNTVDGISGR